MPLDLAPAEVPFEVIVFRLLVPAEVLISIINLTKKNRQPLIPVGSISVLLRCTLHLRHQGRNLGSVKQYRCECAACEGVRSGPLRRAAIILWPIGRLLGCRAAAAHAPAADQVASLADNRPRDQVQTRAFIEDEPAENGAAGGARSSAYGRAPPEILCLPSQFQRPRSGSSRPEMTCCGARNRRISLRPPLPTPRCHHAYTQKPLKTVAASADAIDRRRQKCRFFPDLATKGGT